MKKVDEKGVDLVIDFGKLHMRQVSDFLNTEYTRLDRYGLSLQLDRTTGTR